MAGRKLGRKTAHRLMMFRNMVTSLFDKERIRTTLPRAKELRPIAERMITLGKRESLHARRRALAYIRDSEIVSKLFGSVASRFAQRPGGYTRIIRLGFRDGDGAQMALLELIGSEFKPPKAEEEKGAKKGKKGETPSATAQEAREAPPKEKKPKEKAAKEKPEPPKEKAPKKKAEAPKKEKSRKPNKKRPADD